MLLLLIFVYLNQVKYSATAPATVLVESTNSSQPFEIDRYLFIEAVVYRYPSARDRLRSKGLGGILYLLKVYVLVQVVDDF